MTVETITKGKSLGKLAVGGRIVRLDGGSIGFRHAAIRALVGVFEFYTPPLFGGTAALFGLLTARTQRMGDLLAGTYCQYERVSGRVLPLFGVPPQLTAWARVVDVARMPTQLSRRISQFLSQASQYDLVASSAPRRRTRDRGVGVRRARSRRSTRNCSSPASPSCGASAKPKRCGSNTSDSSACSPPCAVPRTTSHFGMPSSPGSSASARLCAARSCMRAPQYGTRVQLCGA